MNAAATNVAAHVKGHQARKEIQEMRDAELAAQQQRRPRCKVIRGHTTRAMSAPARRWTRRGRRTCRRGCRRRVGHGRGCAGRRANEAEQQQAAERGQASGANIRAGGARMMGRSLMCRLTQQLPCERTGAFSLVRSRPSDGHEVEDELPLGHCCDVRVGVQRRDPTGSGSRCRPQSRDPSNPSFWIDSRTSVSRVGLFRLLAAVSQLRAQHARLRESTLGTLG